MGHILYFVPTDRPVLKLADLRAVGLGHVFDDTTGEPTCAAIGTGPDNLKGVTLDCAYRVSEQVWRKGPDGKFWVGEWVNKEKPGPSHLKRTRFIDGHPVKLRDGNEWTIPIARSIVGGATLPRELVLGEDCKTWKAQELPEFLTLCKDAERVWKAWATAIGAAPEGEAARVEVDGQDLVRIAVDALAVNYRVGPMEVSMLRLLGTEEMWSILRALIDVPAILARAEDKKKADQTSDT